VQTAAVMVNGSIADLFAFGIPAGGDNLLGELLTIPLARIAPLIPYVLMILILFFRPRGLMGTRES
jgi:branched-chain amino acid transport system permease protein